MIGMRVRVMCMVMAMPVIMIVSVTVPMIVATIVAAVMAGGIFVRFCRAGADTLDMMMVTLLRQTYFCFKAKDLLAVLAELTVHVVLAAADLVDTFYERLDHHGMIVQIGRLDEFDIGMDGPPPTEAGSEDGY